MHRLRITLLGLAVATTACNLYFGEPTPTPNGGGGCPGPHCGPTAPDAGVLPVPDAFIPNDGGPIVVDGGGCCNTYPDAEVYPDAGYYEPDGGIVVGCDGGVIAQPDGGVIIPPDAFF